MLSISDLTFSYHARTPVLHQLELAMDRGDILGLLGPNGAGKTSLVSLITGILQPSSGTILIAGEPPRLGRTDIALVPQEYAFYDRLTGRENLAYFAGVLGLGGEAALSAVEAALANCDLSAVADRRAGHYSGGLKRRLNFAVALLQQPRLLILDEPTAGVDPHSRSFLLDVIRQQNRAGVSVIYTSHLLDEVQVLCNRVAILDRGRILQQGSTDQLLAQNARLMTVTLAEPPGEGLLQQLAPQTADGCTLQFDLGATNLTAAQQLQVLEAAGCHIRRVSYGERRLEELFFELIRKELRD